MTKTKSIYLALLAILLSPMAANADPIYDYAGVVTACTGTCASFASLDVGTVVTGEIEINTAPSGSFGDADIANFLFSLFNPALPVSGPVGDPINDNPMQVGSALGTAASTGTSGTTDALNEINGGVMLLEFLAPPLSSNGAFMVFDLSTGDGQICLFYATAGCIPGATQAVVFAGAFTLRGDGSGTPVPEPGTLALFGIGLAGLGFARRKKV